jgi:RNA-directed DNA polymerase
VENDLLLTPTIDHLFDRAFISIEDAGRAWRGPSREVLSHPCSVTLCSTRWTGLERRGHRYVRYADDSNIYVRSERAGQRVMNNVTRFITQKLQLKVNETKSAVARPQERKFLGFSFTNGPVVQRVIAPKALDRFKDRIREITRRAKGVSIKSTVEELARYMVGWRGYFGFCETPEVLIYLTRWVRLRLRCALWRQWKTTRRRREALLQPGVRTRLATNIAGSGRGPWYLARAKALSVGLSNAHFRSLGLPSLFENC